MQTNQRQQPTTRRRQLRQTLSLVEAMAVGLYSISKAFRLEFDARGALEVRSERQTGTAQCPGCRAPYLEADRHRKALITL
jgi:hypothetical protein